MLWLGFHPWPENFHVPWACPKKEKENMGQLVKGVKTKSLTRGQNNSEVFWDGGTHLQHMEVSRLGVESELQLLATATAMWDTSHISNLHHSLRQHGIFKPLSEARD